MIIFRNESMSSEYVTPMTNRSVLTATKAYCIHV